MPMAYRDVIHIGDKAMPYRMTNIIYITIDKLLQDRCPASVLSSWCSVHYNTTGVSRTHLDLYRVYVKLRP